METPENQTEPTAEIRGLANYEVDYIAELNQLSEGGEVSQRASQILLHSFMKGVQAARELGATTGASNGD